MNLCKLLIVCLLSIVYGVLAENKRFVFIVTSYNNRPYIEEALWSLVTQDYPHFRIILIDDCSDDGTQDFVRQFIKRHSLQDTITFVSNSERLFKLRNFYGAAHSCQDDEVIVEVDGDDYLLRDDALTILNRAYQSIKTETWLTYGSYVHDNGTEGLCAQISPAVYQKNAFRDIDWKWGHLRSFYAWLFKCIKKEDFLYNGEFYAMAGDRVYTYPMLEMTAERYTFIPDILYVYRLSGALHDHVVNQRLQRYLARVTELKPKYSRLTSRP